MNPPNIFYLTHIEPEPEPEPEPGKFYVEKKIFTSAPF